MSIELLKEDIKKRKVRNLYLFYGPEEYLKRYYLLSIEKLILDDQLKTLNRIVLEGKQDMGHIIDNCETLPAFSEMKVVIVKNSGFFKSKKKTDSVDKKKKNQRDDLADYIKNIPEHTCLIFYEAEIDKKLKVLEAVKERGLIIEFPVQKHDELVKWVVKAFKANGKEIDSITASQLIDNSDQGMDEILNEVNKLVLFLGERTKVTNHDIENVCSKSIKSRIFDLTDAIAENNCTRALKLLDDIIILKEPIPKILFMITRQFRHILELKLFKNEGLSPNEAASKIGLSPYAAGKIAKQANSFTIDKLKGAIEESLELDAAIKTGKISDRTAAELLITEFTK